MLGYLHSLLSHAQDAAGADSLSVTCVKYSQSVLDFPLFLSRSLFPQFNKDGVSVSPKSLQETLQALIKIA